MRNLIVYLLISLSLLQADTLGDYGYDIELSAHKSETVHLTFQDLNFIYVGRIRNWSDGTRIKLFVRNMVNPCQRNFVLALLGISISKFQEGVNKYEHIQVVSKEMMLAKLENNIGSIGIIDHDEVYLSTERGLVLVEIDE